MPDYEEPEYSPRLATLDEEDGYAAPAERLTSPERAHEIYEDLHDKDEKRAHDRAVIQRMLDGAPPYDPDALRRKGLAGKTNVNFGEGAAARDQALAPYMELVNSVDNLAWIDPDVEDPQRRGDWAQIISEEFTRMIRDWKQFDFNFTSLADGFLVNGVSFSPYQSDDDWTWNAMRLGRVLVPNKSRPFAEDLELACVEEDMAPSDLYSKITGSGAEDAGWNVEFAQKMIVQYAKKQSRTVEDEDYDNWEKLEVAIKNNDLWFGNGIETAGTVPLVNYLVQEFDGSVSHYIGVRSGDHTEEWIYANPSKFESMCDVLTVFAMGIGNDHIHSIRGLGYRIYNLVQLTNRLRCMSADGAAQSSQVMLQPSDTTAGVTAQMTQILEGAGLTIIPGDFNVIERGFPNLSQNAIPQIREMQQIMDSNIGQYRNLSKVPDAVEKTRGQVEIEAEKEAALEMAALNSFYVPWEELLQGIYRRAVQELGTGRDFVERCVARGVPKEVLMEPASVTAVRAIGNGSPQMRQMVQRRILDMAGSFDEVGRNNALTDYLMAQQGVTTYTVRRYIDPAGPRETPAHHFARLENRDFESMANDRGASVNRVTALSTDEHVTHGTIHVSEYIDTTLEAIASGQLPGTAVFGVLAAADHVDEHIAYAELDPSREQETNALREANQQRRNMARKIEQRVSEEMAAEEERQKELAAVEISPEDQQKLNYQKRSNELRLELERELNEIRMTAEDEKADIAVEEEERKALVAVREDAEKARIATRESAADAAIDNVA